MPLFDISPNMQEAQSPSRKRTLDDFAQMEHGELPTLKGIGGRLPDLRHADNSMPFPSALPPLRSTCTLADLQ